MLLNQNSRLRVLVISKQTRWEREKKLLNLDGYALKTELTRKGYPTERIKQSHDSHRYSIDHIVDCLKNRKDLFSNVIMRTSRKDVRVKDLVDIDFIISAGGDGTLLETASLINHKDFNEHYDKTFKPFNDAKHIPLLPINTDPMLSSGSLCSVRFWPTALESKQDNKTKPKGTISTNDFNYIINKIEQHKYKYKTRSRLKVNIVDDSGHKSTLEHLALNEVFFSEIDASRPSVHETTIMAPIREKKLQQNTLYKASFNNIADYSVKHVQRSSGVIVSTGTGSTAWLSSATRMPKLDIQRVLNEYNYQINTKDEVKKHHDLDTKILAKKNTDIKISDPIINRIYAQVNNDCVFPANSKNVQYFVREPVLNGWIGRHDKPLSSHPRHGFGNSVTLRALGFDAALVLDGIHTYHVKYGTTATIKVDKNYPLNYLWFEDDES